MRSRNSIHWYVCSYLQAYKVETSRVMSKIYIKYIKVYTIKFHKDSFIAAAYST